MQESIEDFNKMDIKQYYFDLASESAKTQNLTFEDADSLAATIKAHGYLSDLSTILGLIRAKYESQMFDYALKEYQFALLALTLGQYRHAFIGLRLFFEMSLATFLFSTNELSYRSWEKSRKDINWMELTDENNGIFSKFFINAFNEDLVDHAKAFQSIAKTVYRECSEYVHGNLHTHNNLSPEIIFQKDIFLDWHEKSKNMHVVVLFLFCIRYLPFLDTSRADKSLSTTAQIESIIISELGHIDEIRSLF